MLDFTQGWVWFVSGLSLTLVFAALAVVLAQIAKRSERRGRLGT